VIERQKQEIGLVQSRFDDIEVGSDGDWIIVGRWALPPGWNKTVLKVLVLVPLGYPATPPDNFYTDLDLRIEGGAQPGNTSATSQLGREWLQFSYHVEAGDWQPHAEVLEGHNLLTFLEGVRARLNEVS